MDLQRLEAIKIGETAPGAPLLAGLTGEPTTWRCVEILKHAGKRTWVFDVGFLGISCGTVEIREKGGKLEMHDGTAQR